MDNQVAIEKFAAAVAIISPKSKVAKQLANIPLVGSLTKEFRELFYFRKAFLVKRVLAEHGVSNLALLLNVAEVVLYSWLVIVFWKFAVAGLVVTFTQPNILSVVLLCTSIFIAANLLNSLLTFIAFVLGTWRHAKGTPRMLASIPHANNIFTPKGGAKVGLTFDTPAFPILETPEPMSRPASLPIMSSVLQGDEEQLVGQLVSDVNAIMLEGLYRIDEIWPELIGLYYLDFYVAQVRNGGHSQFTHNAQSNFQQVLEAIDGALSRTQMLKISEVFSAYRQWCARNPWLVPEQTGFTGGHAAALDDLDTQLYDALKLEAYPKALAQSVSSWDFIRAVSENEYAASRAALIGGNPNRTPRKMLQNLNAIRRFFDNRDCLAAMLSLRAAGDKSFFLGLQNGAIYDFDGKQGFAWLFKHSSGKGYLRKQDDGFAFHPQVGEEISFPSFASGATLEEMNAAFDAYSASDDKPRPGPATAFITDSQLDALRLRLKDGAYADLIFATLVAAGVDSDVKGMVLGAHPEDGEDNLIVLVGSSIANVFKIEVIPPSVAGFEQIAVGEKAQRKLFEHAALQSFLKDLEGQDISEGAT